MHFARVDMATRRKLRRQSDMSDFSGRAMIHEPDQPPNIDTLIGALGVLWSLVMAVYQPFVIDLVAEARRFFVELSGLQPSQMQKI